jgi:hypothetical protein
MLGPRSLLRPPRGGQIHARVPLTIRCSVVPSSSSTLRLPNPWSRLSPPGIQRALASPLTLPCSDPRPPPLTIAARSVCVRFSAHVAVLGSTLASFAVSGLRLLFAHVAVLESAFALRSHRNVRPALASSPTLPCSNRPTHSVHIAVTGLR